jgi:hemin uptake protein HemP
MTDAPKRTAPSETAPHQVSRPAEDAAVRDSWRSEELLGEKTEVLIQHGTEVYRLRRTRQGKLILYK